LVVGGVNTLFGYGIVYLVGVTYLTILKPYFNIYLIQAVFLLSMALLSYFLNKSFVFMTLSKSIIREE